MNQELKQLILDICNKYPIYDIGVALSIISERVTIILDNINNYPGQPTLQVQVDTECVYRTHFKIDGDTELDKDVSQIYWLALEKRREQIRQGQEIRRQRQERERIQQRIKMATDPASLSALAKMRAAIQFDQQKNKVR